MDKKQTPKPSITTNDSDRAHGSDEVNATPQPSDAFIEDAPTASFTALGMAPTDSESADAGRPAPAAPNKPQKHAGKMTYSKTMRFIVAPIFALIALILMVCSVLAATVWKPNPIATATGAVSTRYAATDSGVLQLVDSSVRVRAHAQQPVCVAVGNSQDITGWIGTQRYTRIEGLDTWKKLKVGFAENDLGSATAAAGQVAPFADSDLWMQVHCGTSIDFTVKPTATQAVIVDTNPSAAANVATGTPTTISLTWRRTSVGNQSVPLCFAAVLMLIAAVLCATVLAMLPERRRKSLERRKAEEERLRANREPHEQRRVVGIGEDSPRWVKDNVRLKRQLAGRRRHRRHSHRKSGSFFTSLLPAPRKSAEEKKREEDAAAQTMVLNPKAILGLKSDSDSASQNGSSELSAAEVTGTGPKVVDVRGVNLVADTVSRRQAEATAELTAIINGDAPASAESAAAAGVDTSTPSKQYSSDEIADYLRRLSEETLGFDEAPASAGNQSASQQGEQQSGQQAERQTDQQTEQQGESTKNESAHDTEDAEDAQGKDGQ